MTNHQPVGLFSPKGTRIAKWIGIVLGIALVASLGWFAGLLIFLGGIALIALGVRAYTPTTQPRSRSTTFGTAAIALLFGLVSMTGGFASEPEASNAADQSDIPEAAAPISQVPQQSASPKPQASRTPRPSPSVEPSHAEPSPSASPISAPEPARTPEPTPTETKKASAPKQTSKPVEAPAPAPAPAPVAQPAPVANATSPGVKPVSKENCPSSHPIKGNENSGIYHVPGGRYYEATHPEQCFDTKASAEAAGFRASRGG